MKICDVTVKKVVLQVLEPTYGTADLAEIYCDDCKHRTPTCRTEFALAKTDDISDGRKGCVLTQRFNDAFVDIFKRRADERRKDDEESLAEYKSEDGRVRFELAVFDVKRGMRELKKKGYYLFHDDTDHPSFKNDNGEILIPDDVDERSKLGELYTLASEIIKNDGECMTL